MKLRQAMVVGLLVLAVSGGDRQRKLFDCREECYDRFELLRAWPVSVSYDDRDVSLGNHFGPVDAAESLPNSDDRRILGLNIRIADDGTAQLSFGGFVTAPNADTGGTPWRFNVVLRRAQ